MSFRFASEQLANLRYDAQLVIQRSSDQEGQLELAVEDEDVADHSPARLLIAAGTLSEQLLYRLNIIHLTAGNGSEAALI